MEIRLTLIRLALIILCRVMGRRDPLPRWQWMLHYLEGSGTDMDLCSNIETEEAMCGVASDAVYQESTYMPYGSDSIKWESEYMGWVTIHATDLPRDCPLYHTVGGFRLEVEEYEDSFVVDGEDVYDWHPGKKARLPSSIERFYSLMKLAFPSFFSRDGEKYFVHDELLIELQKVGAKEFVSRWKYIFSKP